MVAFTGSTVVGKQLTEMAARYMKPVLMELGGHAPVIVCGDVDPVAAALTSVVRKARNTGQVCTSPTRFYVQKSIYEPFAKAFAEKANDIAVGNGLDPATQMGPLANYRRIEAMETLVADARAGAHGSLQVENAPVTAATSFPSPCLRIFPMTLAR